VCWCVDKEEKDIPLPNVKTAVLNRVVAYLKYHVDNPAKEIEKPLKSANMSEVVSQYDADYVDVEQELLFELILVTQFPLCRARSPSCFLFFGFADRMRMFRLPTTWTSSLPTHNDLCWPSAFDR
jgi:hypothetical protein